MNPTISVILPVYNSERYLAEAIESVLAQSFKSFELIIINDGSKDKSLSIIQHYMHADERVRLINRNNKGLVYSLNEGILLSKGRFIARMDADDICLPTRFEEQLTYMEKHKLDVCGSWIQPFNQSKKLKKRKLPISHSEIIVSSLFHCSFAHPSVMIRKTVFKNLKYENVPAEDYLLWCKIILEGYKVGNIPRVLLEYRIHDSQITQNHKGALRESSDQIASFFANNLGEDEIKVTKQKELFLRNNCQKLYPNIDRTLIKLINKYNLNFKLKNDLLLWLYLQAQPKSPFLYYQYKKLTKGNYVSLTMELNLLLRSLLYFPEDSKILNSLTKKYQKLKR